MLKTLENTEFISKPKKSRVWVGGNGGNDSGRCNDDSDRKFYLRLQLDSCATYLNAQNKLLNRLIN